MCTLSEPLDVMRVAQDAVGQRLRVNRAGRCDVEYEDGTPFDSIGWLDGTMEPLAGRLPLLFLEDAPSSPNTRPCAWPSWQISATELDGARCQGDQVMQLTANVAG